MPLIERTPFGRQSIFLPQNVRDGLTGIHVKSSETSVSFNRIDFHLEVRIKACEIALVLGSIKVMPRTALVTVCSMRHYHIEVSGPGHLMQACIAVSCTDAVVCALPPRRAQAARFVRASNEQMSQS